MPDYKDTKNKMWHEDNIFNNHSAVNKELNGFEWEINGSREEHPHGSNSIRSEYFHLLRTKSKSYLGHNLHKDHLFSINRDYSDDHYPPRKPLELKGEDDDDCEKEEINEGEAKEEVKEIQKEDKYQKEESKEVEISNISDDPEDEEEEENDAKTGSKIIRASSLVKTTKLDS